MKRKNLLLGIALILGFSLITSILNIKEQSNLVAMAYNASGAKLVTCNINSYAELKNKSKLSIDQLMDIEKEVCVTLALHSYNINNQQNNISDTTNEVLVNLSDNLGRIFNIKVECYKVDKNEYTTYIYVDAILDSNINYLNDTYKLIKSCYKTFKIKPIINTCIVGSYDGKLDEEALSTLKESINNTTKVKLVENIRYLNSQSVTAYNPNASNYILSNGKKINFNYALRYNTLENRTYIYIASPIINIEY